MIASTIVVLAFIASNDEVQKKLLSKYLIYV